MKLMTQTRTVAREQKERDGGALGAGLTLIESMIVTAMILILIGMAAQRYEKTVQRVRDATLRQDHWVLREAIENYSLDKQAVPQSLDDLVRAGYLSKATADQMHEAASEELQ